MALAASLIHTEVSRVQPVHPAPAPQRQRARQSRTKNRKSWKWCRGGLAEHNQRLVTLRSKDKESSEKTAIVNFLHAIAPLSEGCSTSLMSSKIRLCHSSFMHHCASSSVLLRLNHTYICALRVKFILRMCTPNDMCVYVCIRL